MSKDVEYRRYAAALLDIAARTASAADKFRLLVMAQAWFRLADKFARVTKRHRAGGPPLPPRGSKGPIEDRPEAD
jgi:hypothetical protein